MIFFVALNIPATLKKILHGSKLSKCCQSLTSPAWNGLSPRAHNRSEVLIEQHLFLSFRQKASRKNDSGKIAQSLAMSDFSLGLSSYLAANADKPWTFYFCSEITLAGTAIQLHHRRLAAVELTRMRPHRLAIRCGGNVPKCNTYKSFVILADAWSKRKATQRCAH